jgi:hypothetical protein
MNIFRGYTDGLASSYGVATCQSSAFARPKAPSPATPKLARLSFVKAVQAVVRIVSKRRGSSPAPSDHSSMISRVFTLFARQATPQLS